MPQGILKEKGAKSDNEEDREKQKKIDKMMKSRKRKFKHNSGPTYTDSWDASPMASFKDTLIQKDLLPILHASS